MSSNACAQAVHSAQALALHQISLRQHVHQLLVGLAVGRITLNDVKSGLSINKMENGTCVEFAHYTLNKFYLSIQHSITWIDTMAYVNAELQLYSNVNLDHHSCSLRSWLFLYTIRIVVCTYVPMHRPPSKEFFPLINCQLLSISWWVHHDWTSFVWISVCIPHGVYMFVTHHTLRGWDALCIVFE